MPGQSIVIRNPAQNSTIGRLLQVSGRVTQAGGSVLSVNIQFGDGGPTVDATSPGHGFNWTWQGRVPNTIRPGQAFHIIVSTSGEAFRRSPEPPHNLEPVDVDGSAKVDVVLENVVPVLTVNPFQSPIVVREVPYAFTLSGTVSEGNGFPYVPQVQYQVGDGPLTNAAVSQGTWSATLSLQLGNNPITVRAFDAFDSVAIFPQQTITVLLFQMGVPTTSSITTWTRLEPQCSNADISATTSARLFDPLWLMTRQWQMGEFQGEDTGSPVQARVRATNATLSRWYFGELSQNSAAPRYSLARGPLETFVERRAMRAFSQNDHRMLTLAVDAGQHFLRMLELDQTGKKYINAFLTSSNLVMQQLSPQAAPLVDDATARFVQTMAGRALDARPLREALRHQAVPDFVAHSDVPAVQQIAAAWMAWYDGLFAELAGPEVDAWVPSRLEYAVSVAARLSVQPQDGITLSASEFDGGRLDWSSFDVNNTFNIDTTGDQTFVPLNETTVPAPVTFRGAPAARFWELEDAQVAFGLLSAGPPDLAHLLMIEYASSYGNDWFVVPLKIPVGSVTRVDSLVVTDTFGVRSLLRPIGDPALAKPYFSMWQLALKRYAGNEIQAPMTNLFFLPPTIGRSIDSGVLEDVLFMRDEMANIAWAIERSVEGAIEMPVQLAAGLTETVAPPSPAAPAGSDALPRYLLATSVPANWIPLLPVEQDDHGNLVSRLRRGAVLQPDGTKKIHHARSGALNALANELLYDEEVPREGVHITRRRRMTRWIDGSTWVWTAFRNEVGRGEGSAGLQFDQLIEPNGSQK